MTDLQGGTPEEAGTEGTASGQPTADAGTAPASTPAPAADQHQAAEADLDLLADVGDDAGEDAGAEGQDSAAEPAGDEQQDRSPWPARPEKLDAADEDAVAAWKQEAGLAARDEYEIPKLAEGLHYTEYGQTLAEKVTGLGYELDLSPAQTQQLILKGDGLLKTLAEAHDAEHQRSGSKAIIDSFNGDREAAQAHVTQARSALRKAMPTGLDKLLLDSRGPDGRKLGHNPQILRWAAQLGARVQTKDTTNMTEDAKAELAQISELRTRDIGEYWRPNYKGSGKSAADRALELQRQIDAAASVQEHDTSVRSASSDEERELLALHRNDPAFFEHGRWKDSGVSPSQRLHDLRQGRR